MGELRHRERHVSGPRQPGQTPPDRIQNDPMQGTVAIIGRDAQDGPSLGHSGDQVYLHNVSLFLASIPWAPGPAHTLVTASACKPFPSLVGIRKAPLAAWTQRARLLIPLG